MKETDYLLSLKHTLWYVLAGTRGGFTRIEILELLRKRPYNMNQLHEKLNLDYKTIQHHIRILTSEKIITTDEKRYGSIYFLSPVLESDPAILDEILEKCGKREISKKDKK